MKLPNSPVFSRKLSVFFLAWLLIPCVIAYGIYFIDALLFRGALLGASLQAATNQTAFWIVIGCSEIGGLIIAIMLARKTKN